MSPERKAELRAIARKSYRWPTYAELREALDALDEAEAARDEALDAMCGEPSKLRAAEAREARLREALAFYAAGRFHDKEHQAGEVARAALKETDHD